MRIGPRAFAHEDLTSPPEEQGSALHRPGAVPGPHRTTGSPRGLARRVRAPGGALLRRGREGGACSLASLFLRLPQAGLFVLTVLLLSTHTFAAAPRHHRLLTFRPACEAHHPSHGRPQGPRPEEGHQGGVGRAQAGGRARNGVGSKSESHVDQGQREGCRGRADEGRGQTPGGAGFVVLEGQALGFGGFGRLQGEDEAVDADNGGASDGLGDAPRRPRCSRWAPVTSSPHRPQRQRERSPAPRCQFV